ncbi:protein of unknown function [Candidatus Methylomirabilis oxygeniifera]|uniref:Uncharacterized protein n=1 Tax=Methylomirabilis oxygeniifera TaxID=671143 RepID=D5MHG8_METO1|nr:protein of unknown function [Candidatus Methylomirabilis oxyfera]
MQPVKRGYIVTVSLLATKGCAAIRYAVSLQTAGDTIPSEILPLRFIPRRHDYSSLIILFHSLQ